MSTGSVGEDDLLPHLDLGAAGQRELDQVEVVEGAGGDPHLVAVAHVVEHHVLAQRRRVVHHVEVGSGLGQRQVMGTESFGDGFSRLIHVGGGDNGVTAQQGTGQGRLLARGSIDRRA